MHAILKWNIFKCLFDVGSPHFTSFNFNFSSSFIRYRVPPFRLRSTYQWQPFQLNKLVIANVILWNNSLTNNRFVFNSQNNFILLAFDFENLPSANAILHKCVKRTIPKSNPEKYANQYIRKCVINVREIFHLVFKSLRLRCWCCCCCCYSRRRHHHRCHCENPIGIGIVKPQENNSV